MPEQSNTRRSNGRYKLQIAGVVSVVVVILSLMGVLVREVRHQDAIETSVKVMGADLDRHQSAIKASIKVMRADLDKLIAWRDVWQERVLPLDEGQNKEIAAVTEAVSKLGGQIDSMRDKLELTRLRLERIRPDDGGPD